MPIIDTEPEPHLCADVVVDQPTAQVKGWIGSRRNAYDDIEFSLLTGPDSPSGRWAGQA